ncbi:MAG: hypothetical protein ACLFWL_02295 [Candidatus Brocadiia bacterium]
MKRVLEALFVCALIFLTGCSTFAQAPQTADGSKIQIKVACNRGNPDEMNDAQYKRRIQVGRWMERDLVRLLNDVGYEASLIESENDYESAARRYLLKVSIESYNPGSTAGRAFVGYGVGAASLNNHYDFYKDPPDALLTWDDGRGSSRGWMHTCRKLNIEAITKITDYLKTQMANASP